jgi:hypothetical protein
MVTVVDGLQVFLLKERRDEVVEFLLAPELRAEYGCML